MTALGLDAARWTIDHAEDRPRTVTRDGEGAEILDAVVLARRLSG